MLQVKRMGDPGRQVLEAGSQGACDGRPAGAGRRPQAFGGKKMATREMV